MARDRRARLWWVGSIAAAYFVLSAALLVLHPLPEPLQHHFASLAGIPSMVAAAALATLAAWRGAGHARRGWALIAAGALCSAIGDSIWSFYELVRGNPDPYPSIADAFYLAIIPLLLGGILLLSSARGTLGRLRTGLDACVLLVAALALAWPAVIAPARAASEAGNLEQLISGAYPAGDILLLWAIAVALRRQWAGKARIILALFAIGIVIFTGGDLGFAYLSLRGTYLSGDLIDLGWSAGFLVMGCSAALYAHWRPNLAPEVRLHVAAAWRNSLPLAVMLALGGWLLAKGLQGRPVEDRVQLAIIAAGLVAVVAREVITLRENASLNRDLDRRVRARTRDLQTSVDLTRHLAAARTVDAVLAATADALRRGGGGTAAQRLHRRAHAAAAHGEHPGGAPWERAGFRHDAARATVTAAVGTPPLALIEVSGVWRAPSNPAAVEALVIEAGIALENATRFASAQHDATHDALTGLWNQRSFYDHLRAALDTGDGERGALSIALLDIDGFRLLNETYGRLQGDTVLRLVARVIRGRLPRGGLAARYGGDEFAVLLPCGGTEAAAFVERLQRAVERVQVKLPGATLPVRVSCGLVSSPEHGTTAHSLLVGADANLLLARRRGSAAAALPLGLQRLGGNYGVLLGLIAAIDRRDNYTLRHCEMVAEYAARLAAALGLSAQAQRSVAIAGMLHDVGKIAVPDAVLCKPGPLTAEETALMRQHVAIAPGLILDVPDRNEVVDGVIHHHERWDGGGYLRGLAGEAIPYIARIISVVDVYSALTLDRPYRKGVSQQVAIAELEAAAGSQLDPALTATFITMLRAEATEAAAAAKAAETVKVAETAQAAQAAEAAA